jgi:phage tail protein X
VTEVPMSETIETITIQGEGITASLLVWRWFKRPMPGLVERVYELNPRLPLVGPVLPVGTVLRLPVPVTKAEPDVTPVRLCS